MEKAYLCPTCGASVILEEGSSSTCCFCRSALESKDEIADPKGGFYVGKMGSVKMRRSTCGKCGKSMFMLESSDVKAARCLSCGSDDLLSVNEETVFPSEVVMAPFSCNRKEAEEEYLKSVKQGKHSYSGHEYLEAITPAYVPFFFYDYHTFGNGILSVVPQVKVPKNRLEKIIAVTLLNDISFERTSSVATPYAKTFSSEMAWQSVPACACEAFSQTKIDEISPFLRSGSGTANASVLNLKDAVIPAPDLSAKEIEDGFMQRIRCFVKECLVTENLAHFTITSYIDNTKYTPPLGQLIFIPMWVMKIGKKGQCLTWYMNAITGKSSDVTWESLEKSAPVRETAPTLKTMSKKKIKAFTIEDFGPEDRPVNYRTFMIDTVASSIVSEMTLNEMSADKSLLHLEKVQRQERRTVSAPIPTRGYQADAEEEVKKSREHAIPSAPVPLPTEHSQLYIMREEARNRSIRRGKSLPKTPVDRKVGNEDQVIREDTPSSVAVEFGLADLPEYDPAGPNPFKK
jgi:ribosomal protein S27AE